MIDDKLLSSILQDDQVEPFLSMENIDFNGAKILAAVAICCSFLQSFPLLPNLFSESQVAERFHVTLRTVLHRARERNLGRKLSGVRWFSEAEIKKRHGSKFWTARGTYCGVKADRSLGVTERRETQAILEKFQKEIFERASGRIPEKAGPSFVQAVISYVKLGGERRFVEPLLKYFGEVPIDTIDQAAINAAAIALYPNGSSSTRNRQVYGPVSAILKSNGISTKVHRLEPPEGVVRSIT